MGSECADNFHAMENGMASKVADSSCEESTHPLKLEAHNVSYNLDTSANTWVERLTSLEMPWEWKLSSQKKKVLSDINFSVTSGHLLAIMGGSGSGKTSLLNVLSQRANMEDASGSVLIDGYPRDSSFMRDHSAYIMQDDFLIPHLSVIESLTFVAHLKLPSGCKKNQIQREITNLITELGLIHVANSKIGGEKLRGLSGGERRRVSIAMQLLLDPKILFLDEPTSGLDSFTAYNLVGMLTKLAQKDKLLIMTIHQPRSNIFELFDQVMILTEGNMTYYGDANRMVPYFQEIGHRCPELTNPCDFYVDLASIDRKSPRTETESRRRVTQLVKIFKKSYLTKNKKRISHVFDNEMGYFDEFELGQQAKSSSEESLSVKPVKHISVFRQFSVLTRRAIKSHIEDYGFLAVQAFEAICMSLMLGLIFWQLGFGVDGMQDRFGLMYITGALYPYMIILDVIGDYYKELPILYRELQDGLYSVGPYFFSKLMSELPEHSAFIVLYSVPMYWMANLQPELDLFLEVFGVVYTIVLVSRCLALAGAAIMPTYQTSVLFTQSFFTMFLLSSGYLINLDNLFIGMRWFTNLSYLRWGYLALCQIEITNLNFTCPDSDTSYSNWTVSNRTASSLTDCNIPGKLALEQYSVDGYSVDIAVAILWTFVIFFLFVFFISLKLISQRPRD